MAGYGEFLKGLLDDPRGVSAPTPSSPALAAAIAAKLDPSRPGLVLELGPGTGVVTEAILARGIAPERLLAIENNEFFVDLLKDTFPQVAVKCGDALQFETCLPENAEIAAVVSGVPLLNFPPAIRRALINKALGFQTRGGSFIQLSYGWRPAVEPDPSLLLEKTVVWRNFPPAHIWTYRRADIH